jgi:hypothetical protein
LKNFVGEYSDRHDVVNVRDLAVVDWRLWAARTDAVLHRHQPGPFVCKPETLRSEPVRMPISKQMNDHVLIAINHQLHTHKQRDT